MKTHSDIIQIKHLNDIQIISISIKLTFLLLDLHLNKQSSASQYADFFRIFSI